MTPNRIHFMLEISSKAKDDETMAKILAFARDVEAEVVRPGPVTQAWTHRLSMMQQSVLLAAIRGPDLRQLDALPHHYQMHFMHAVEIVGYKHPNSEIRHFWHQLYLRLVHDFHLWPETQEQLDDRLGDTRSGWLKRADPATAA